MAISPLPPLPALGSTSWHSYMSARDAAIRALLAAPATSDPGTTDPIEPPVSYPQPGATLEVVTSPTRVVNVTTRAQLETALGNLAWGDKIVLAAGQYGSSTNLVITAPSMSGYSQGNPPKGIWIIGPAGRTAVFNRGAVASGYALSMDKANYVQLENLKFTGGQKGIMFDETNFSRVINCDIGNVGHEAVHWRNNSSDNLIQGSVVHDTGLDNTDYGEGVYFGQSNTNWDAATSRTGGAADRSDRNQAIGNTLTNITAECFDIKEGTTGGVVRGNTMSGSAVAGTNSADSYIDVKGNDYLIEGNTATGPSASIVHAFSTHILYAGYGNGNVFKNNTVVAGGKSSGAENSATGGSQGFNIQTSGSRGSATGNIVYSDNVATGAPGGLTNLPVTPA